jgi:hypothetical protein
MCRQAARREPRVFLARVDDCLRTIAQALISAEGAGSAPYVLMAGFPPAQLNDAAQTIEAAGLKGAQITQKLA